MPKRKRVGRPPQGRIRNKSAVFSTRITPETREALEEAKNLSGRSLSQEIEERLKGSFRSARTCTGLDRESNHTQGLAVLIAVLAGRIERATDKSWRDDAGTAIAVHAGIGTLMEFLAPSSKEEPIVTVPDVFKRAQARSADMPPPAQYGVIQAYHMLYELPIAKYPDAWEDKPAGLIASDSFATLAWIQEKLGIKRRHVEWSDFAVVPAETTKGQSK